MTQLSIGISTCPNDTFAFHALMTGAVRVPNLKLEFELHDIDGNLIASGAQRFQIAQQVGFGHAVEEVIPAAPARGERRRSPRACFAPPARGISLEKPIDLIVDRHIQ